MRSTSLHVSFLLASLVAVLACVGECSVSTAYAAPTTFSIALDGSQEVGFGDLGATGMGMITFDPEADTISWNVDYFNLLDDIIYPVSITGWHIHGSNGPPGVNASILVDLDNLAGLLVPNGTLSGGPIAADSDNIDAILADPGDFYLNLHTSDNFGGFFAGFPDGAIRGQVPEPSTFVLLGLGCLGLLYCGWRRGRTT